MLLAWITNSRDRDRLCNVSKDIRNHIGDVNNLVRCFRNVSGGVRNIKFGVRDVGKVVFDGVSYSLVIVFIKCNGYAPALEMFVMEVFMVFFSLTTPS